MNRPPDSLLTLLLLAPCLVAGVVAAILLRPASWTARGPRRLSDAEVRAMYKITAERARQGQWN